MWCAQCGQDVLAVPHGDDPNAVRCLQCGAECVTAPDGLPSGRDPTSEAFARVVRRVEDACPIEPPPRITDDWEWEDAAARPDRLSGAPTLNTHDARSMAPELASQSVDRGSAQRPRSNGFCWLLLSLGVALFTCGAGLIGYSFLGEREALWDLGTPLVLAGQATFLVGLVLQLDVIWQQSKEANQTLHDLDQRLGPWKEPTAGPLSGAVSVADSIARIHPGNGSVAPPHLALQDLQGRLETIGTQLTGHGGS